MTVYAAAFFAAARCKRQCFQVQRSRPDRRNRVVTTGVSLRGTVPGTFAAMGSPLDQEADKSAIEALVTQFNEAWNRHDAHALAALFAEDADFTNAR
jgi:hypothetical protein